jgi:hypothetical protein
MQLPDLVEGTIGVSGLVESAQPTLEARFAPPHFVLATGFISC